MRLIFNDLGTALSVKSCYSKFLSSSALILLMLLLSAAFMMEKEETHRFYANTLNLALATEK